MQFSSLSSLTVLRRGHETGEKARHRVSASCLCAFSTFTPRPNFTVRNPGCVIHRSPSIQWTRVDPRLLTEPTVNQRRLGTLMPACAWLIRLLSSLMCVPMEAGECWFADQVLVPLTSLNAHMKADVRSPLGCSPLGFVCENLKRVL